MKICFVTSSLSPLNGYGRVSLNLLDEFYKYGIVENVLIQQNESKNSNFKNKIHPSLKINLTSPLSHPIDLIHDRRLIQKLSSKCDLIHFLVEAPILTSLIPYNIPYIVTTYGTWAIRPLSSNPLSKLAFSRAYSNASSIVSISQTTKDRLYDLLPINNHKVIPLGIEIPELDRPKNISKNSLKFLSVSSLNLGKGYDISIEAIARLSIKYPNTEYHIVTGRKSSQLENSLREIARKYSFNKLFFYNQINDKQKNKLYKNSDFFILTPVERNGDYEGFGLIYLEAATFGLPIIGSKSGAVEEVLSKLESAILVKEADVEDTYNSVLSLILDPKKYFTLSKNGLNNISKFDIKITAKEYLDLYKKSVL